MPAGHMPESQPSEGASLISEIGTTCLAMTIEALAHVMERDASTLDAGTSLSALGVDSVALVMWADHVEGDLRRTHGLDARVPDALLRGVVTAADLARGLEPVVADALHLPFAAPLAGFGEQDRLSSQLSSPHSSRHSSRRSPDHRSLS
jgi:hypothetical protein